MKINTILCFAFVFSIIGFAHAKDIFEATRDDDLDAIQALVATNASVVNTMDTNGDTPLFTAVELEHTNIAIFLLSKGADPTITNNNGVSSILMAKVLGDQEVLGLVDSKPKNTIESSQQINNITTNEQTHDEADIMRTNEYVSLSVGAGILRVLDERGIILQIGDIDQPRIPLEALNNNDLQKLLKCKIVYSALTCFGRDNNANKDQHSQIANQIEQIWELGASLQQKIQTRLKIFKNLGEYNSDLILWRRYAQKNSDCIQELGIKYEYMLQQASTGLSPEDALTSPQVLAVYQMMGNDPIAKARDFAGDQAEVYASRMQACVGRLTIYGVTVTSVSTDAGAPFETSFLNPAAQVCVITPFRCDIKQTE